jgi:amino acid transporter
VDLVEEEEVAMVVVIAVAAMVAVIAVATEVVIAVAAMVVVIAVATEVVIAVATEVVIAVAAMVVVIVLTLINLLEQKVGKTEVMEILLKTLNMKVVGAGEKGAYLMIAMLQMKQISNPFFQALSLI